MTLVPLVFPLTSPKSPKPDIVKGAVYHVMNELPFYYHSTMPDTHAQNSVVLLIGYQFPPFVSLEISSNLPRHSPLLPILNTQNPLILPTLARLLPQPLKFPLPINTHSPNTLSQPLMPLPILLYPLLNLSLIQPREAYSVCFQQRSRFSVLNCSLGIG